MKFNCPTCGQRIQCDEGLAGRHERCPSCNTKIAVPAAPAPVAETEEAAPAVGKKSAQQARVFLVKKPGRAPSLRRATSISAGTSGTNVSAFATGLLGLGFTVVFYLLMLALRATQMGALFLARGWVPYMEAFLFWWAVAILMLKSKKLARQKQCMLFDILPEEISQDITQDSIGLFIEHARLLKEKAAESFLTLRVLKVLEHFRVRNSNPEAATVLSSQSDVDANAVQSSYTLIKIFIWAIPILGFIGTVQGLGSAVGGFASGLELAQDIAVLKGSLGKITVGLAVAFDTTLIALIMAIPLMFFASSMQKAEEDVLNAIDEFCTENLLKRLNERNCDLVSDEGSQNLVFRMREAMEAAFARHLEGLGAWSVKLESMGGLLGNQVADGWRHVQGDLQSQHAEHMKAMRGLHGEACDKSVATLKEINGVHEIMSALQKSQAEQVKAVVEATSESLAITHEQVEALRQHFASLTEGLAALNRALERLGEKPVAVPTGKPSFWSRLTGKG